ncbi:hypothetical protein CEUSTIGMA_g12599.t1 [Chlamydomonas eustigma]|uniref:Uncharacterized protein n=1 Tax=Chlamydomonas eustigma TaxID=1157962 RepID=A0A250XQ23_9CHLO|nr:hypothetical protein CEUSTIGMA_g12599.t1 [Chlamydomonas eustigma]|eukprot:GAX85181.1 hypothetical protein CEUSTIGMA_g12599.t1 [Chlamydomonas eustigma]
MPSTSGRLPGVLEYAKSHRRSLLASGAGVLVAYYIYRMYSSSAYAEHSKNPSTFQKWKSVLSNYAEALSSFSGTISVISSDVHAYVTSDSSDIPRSIQQLMKVLHSAELQALLQSTASNIARGCAEAVGTSQAADGNSTVTAILDAIFSERGRSLLSLAVGVASSNATSAFCEYLGRMQQMSTSSSSDTPSQFSLDAILQLLASDSGEKIITLLITKSIKSAVKTYVEATAGINMYDDMLGSMAKPEHRDIVTDMVSRSTAAFCKEVAAAYRKASMPAANSASQVTACRSASLSHQETISCATASTTDVVCKSRSRSNSHDGGMGFAGQAPSVMLLHSSSPAVDTGPGQSQPLRYSKLPAMRNVVAAAGGAAPGGCTSSGRQNALKPSSQVWVKQVVELVKEREVSPFTQDC